MGACKACGEIFGALELKNGLCEKCIADGYVMKKVVKEKTVAKEQPNSNLIPCKTCGKEISKTAKQCPHCGEEYTVSRNTKEVNKLAKEYASSGSKSRLVSLLFTGIFGVFGLFYASVGAGFILLIVDGFLLAGALDKTDGGKNLSDAGVLILIFCIYILPILWGDRIIVKQKKKLLAEAKLMRG